jgi:glyoxylase-like metal-dependent hydrolase (beta-lactamase superfamily II)
MDKAGIKQTATDPELPTLTFPFSAPPAAADVTDISADIKWLRLPMPYALDHVNVYLLRVENGWLLIDTGLDSPATRAIWEDVFSGPFKGETLVGIYCTHYHVDHAGLAGYLAERWRVPLFMSYEEYFTLRGWPMDLQEVHWQHAEFFLRAGLPNEILPRTLVMFDFSREISPPPPSFVRLREGSPLAMAGGDWRIMTCEGHSPEHALLFSAQRATLFSGDQLLPRITSNVSVSVVNPHDEPLSCWLTSLDRLTELSDEVLVLPGHGLPFRGARMRVEELRRHHEEKFREIQEACADAPLSAYELMQILYPRTLSDFELQLALGECLAHLHYLRSRGRLTERAVGEGVIRYRSTPALQQAR